MVRRVHMSAPRPPFYDKGVTKVLANRYSQLTAQRGQNQDVWARRGDQAGGDATRGTPPLMLTRLRGSYRSPLRVLPLAAALLLNIIASPLSPNIATANHPNLSVAKTPDGGTVTVGSAITFTIRVSNTQQQGGHVNVAASNVTITDDLPAGFTWSEAVDQPECGVGAANAQGVQRLSCSGGRLSSLAVGQSFEVSVTSATDAGDCGTKTNTASITATGVNNPPSDQGSVTVQCPALTIAKTPDGGSVTAGSNIGFRVRVANGSASGTLTANNVEIDDPLPAGFAWTESPENANCQINTSDGNQTLQCSEITIPPGGEFVVDVSSATDAGDCGTKNNTATTRASNHGQIADSGSVTVQCFPDAHVSKSASGSTVTAPTSYSYTITGVNDGIGATGVVITDDLDDDLTGGTATYDVNPGSGQDGTCTVATTGQGNNQNKNVVTCPPSGSIPLTATDGTAGGNDTVAVTVNVTAPVAACGTVSNTATISATNEPTADQNDNSSGQVNVTVNCPDVSVGKTTTTGSVSAGEDVSYSVTATAGTATAGGTGTSTAVTLTDNLPDGLAWDVTGQTTNCAITGEDDLNDSEGTLVCQFGDMAATTTRTVALNATTDANDCGTILNTATVSSGNDTDGANNGSGEIPITVNCPNLFISKVGPNSSVSAGSSFQYTITADNRGSGQAFGVVVTDDLPDDLVLVSATYDVDPGQGGDLPCQPEVGTGNVVTCNVGTLAASSNPGNSGPDVVEVVITALAGVDACGTVTNVATVDATNERAADESNNTSNPATETTVDCDALVVNKSPDSAGEDGGEVSAGDNIVFEIEVENQQDGADATGVELTDQLPKLDGGGVWQIVDQQGNDEFDSCSFQTSQAGVQTLTCTADEIRSNDARSVIVSAQTTAADCVDETIANTASVTSDTGVGDEDPGVVSIVCPDVEITKDVSSSSVDGGEAFSYTITVNNIGGGSAIGVVVTDDVDPRLEIVDAYFQIDPRQGGRATDCVFGAEGNENVVTCDLGDERLAPNDDNPNGPDTVRVTIEVTAPTTECGSISNAASVSADNEPSTQPARSDNATDPVFVEVLCPDVTVTQAASESVVEAGDTYFYDITVRNVGDGTAHGVLLLDDLPDQLTVNGPNGATYDVDPNSGGGRGRCDVDDNNVVRCAIDALPGGDGGLEAENGDGDTSNVAVVTIEVTAPSDHCPDASTVPNDGAIVSAENEPDELEDENNTSNPTSVAVTCTDEDNNKNHTPGENRHPTNGPYSDLKGANVELVFDDGEPNQGEVGASQSVQTDAVFAVAVFSHTQERAATLTCGQGDTATSVSFRFSYEVRNGETVPAGASLVVYLSPNQGAVNGNADAHGNGDGVRSEQEEANYIADVESNYIVLDVGGLTGRGTMSGTVQVTRPFRLSRGGVLGVFAQEQQRDISHSKTNSLNCADAVPGDPGDVRGGRGTAPTPSPSARAGAPNTATDLSPIDSRQALGFSVVIALGSLWFLGRGVVADRRRRGV